MHAGPLPPEYHTAQRATHSLELGHKLALRSPAAAHSRDARDGEEGVEVERNRDVVEGAEVGGGRWREQQHGV